MDAAPAVGPVASRLDAELLAYAGLTAASLGWASAYVAGKLALAEMTPLTAVLSALLLGERFGPAQVIGGGAVLAGVYWSTRARSA